MTSKYFPTLIIGAGGTGTKVLRFVQTLAESGRHEDLKHMLDIGAMQMVAIDTDSKSNQEEIVTESSQHTSFKEEEDRLPSRLAKLPKNWIHLNREDINQAVARVHEPTTVEDHTEGDVELKFPLAKTREWFPIRNEKTNDRITLGHSKNAGAAQWRPLGRMALFINASRIYETIRRAFRVVQQADLEQGPVRAYIICSLAGGTGSGMFWDLAFFIQMIEPGTITSGMFLLGDPFVDADESHRIYPNIYAALKEIASFKNWRKTFKVNYPIGAGLTFKGQPNGPFAFDMIYLYQTFPHGIEVADRANATIDTSCFRIAQNLLALCRRDLNAILDAGANNLDSETTAMASAPEACYCFSTTGTTLFAIHHSRDISEELFQLLLRDLRPEPFKKSVPLSRQELLAKLGQKENCNPLTLRKNCLGKELLLKTPEELQKYIGQIGDAIERVKNRPADSFDELVKGLDPALVKALSEAADTDNHLILGDCTDGMHAEIGAGLDQDLEMFKTKAADLPASLTLDALDLLAQWLGELSEGLPQVNARWEITVGKPKDLSKFLGGELKGVQSLMVPLLNLFTSTDHVLQNRRDSGLRLLTDLRQSLVDFKLVSSATVEPLLNRLWNEKREQWRECIANLRQRAVELDSEERTRLEQDAGIQFLFEKFILNYKRPDPGHLHEFLRVCIPPEHGLTRNDWLYEHQKFLANVLTRSFNAGQIRDRDRNIEAEQLQEPVQALAEAYDAQSRNDAKLLNLIPLKEFILSILNGNEITDGLRTAKDAQILVDTVRRVNDAIVDYWQSKANLIILAGGEKGLRERLLRCRSKLFSSGIIENKINKRHLIVMPYSEASANITKDDRHHIKESFDAMAQAVMHTKSHVISEPTDSPIIFFNDLFRSAEEITRIGDYYRAYKSFGKDGNTAFYHIHRDLAALLPEVVGQANELTPALCGNPGCTKNMRDVSRAETNCPGCGNPIWNRCGNINCAEDNLRDILLPEGVQGFKPQLPYNCPGCHQDLKTYWWHCPDKGHTQRISTDKETCPECLIEFHDGHKVYQDLKQRPDLRHMACAGCITIEPDDTKRTKIHMSLKPYYEKGLIVDDTLRFCDLIQQFQQYGIDYHICGNFVLEHYLFPTCPEGKDDPKTRHHLHEREGVFVCTLHPEFEFYQCHNCGYPVQNKAGLFQSCPRCTKPVKKCHYCSDRHNKLYEPMVGKDPARCPNCRNLMKTKCPAQDELLHAGLEEPAFCANIYSCMAGRDPWHTATEYSMAICRVCPGTPSPLLPRNVLVEIVRACPLCSVVLSPIVENNRERWISGKHLLEHYCHLPDIEEALRRPCLMCGAVPKVILRWMQKSGFLYCLEHPRATQVQAAPKEATSAQHDEFERLLEQVTIDFLDDIPFTDALEVLISLRDHLNDVAAFLDLKGHLRMHDVLSWHSAQKEAILQLFPQGSTFASILRYRLNGLWQKLIPTCPLGEDHYLYLNETMRWACPRHTQHEFFACGHCGYPIQEGAARQTCQRCLNELEPCYYCSPTTHRYHIIPKTNPKRCPNCTYLMAGPDNDLDTYTLQKYLNFPAFCPNLFGCRAAKDPRSAQTELNHQTCRSCVKAPLLPSAFLDGILARCPLCMLLIGDDGKGETLDQAILDRSCRICSTKPKNILLWAKRDKKTAEEETVLKRFAFEADEHLQQRLPKLRFGVGLAMLRAFISTQNGALAFKKLAANRDFDLDTLDRDTLKSLLGFFQPGTKVFELLELRVDEMIHAMPECLR